jgi:hypothetical protein
MHGRVCAILVLLLLPLVAATARAQPAASAEADALAHLEAGIAAYRAADYATAYREFSLAHDGAPDKPNPYRWLALTEAKLGDCTAARAHAAEFLARVPPDDPRAPELIQLRVVCDRAAPPTGTSTTPPSPAPSRPITRRWWFWTAIAGGAAVVAGAIILTTRADDPTELPPIVCNASGCGP